MVNLVNITSANHQHVSTLTLAFSSRHFCTTHLREMIHLSKQVTEHGVYVVHLRKGEQKHFGF